MICGENRFFIQFSDEIATVSLLRVDQADHGPVVSDFGNWCDESDLYLNVSKTTFPLILGKKALNSSPLLFTMKLLTILNMFEW